MQSASRAFNFDISYNLSRTYQHRGFKWIALFLMLVLLIIFTVFNVATNGYTLQPTVTLSPNTTEAQRSWFNKGIFTWGDSRLNPQCQDIEIGIGFQFLTTNQGSVHTVNGITGPCGKDGHIRQCPSVSYHAQTLENCAVDSVIINLVKTDNSLSMNGAWWWSYGSSSAIAQAHCEVSAPTGVYTIGFDSNDPGFTKYFANYLAVEDYNTSASLWWGSRLMDDYLTGVKAVTAQGGTGNVSSNTENGQLSFTTSSNTTSIRGPTLFNTGFFFFESSGGIINPNSEDATDQQYYFNNNSFWLSPILTEGLFFAKVFYSFVLTDLGQNKSANALLDDESLQYALNPEDDFYRQPGGTLYGETRFDWWRWNGITPPGEDQSQNNSVLMADALTTFPKSTLGTKPATIFSQYTCSVPQRKGISAIVLAVLISDLVLLTASWSILKFVATTYTTIKDPTAMYCEGCAAQRREGAGDNVALLPLKTPELAFPSRKPVPSRLGPGRGYESLQGDDAFIR